MNICKLQILYESGSKMAARLQFHPIVFLWGMPFSGIFIIQLGTVFAFCGIGPICITVLAPVHFCI